MRDRFGAFRQHAHTLLSAEHSRRPVSISGPTPLALVYPNSYATGMASLGFQTVYRLFNEQPLIKCERAFVFEGPFAHFYHTLESQRPLNEFRIVAFSLAFEMDYTNALLLMKQAGIPLLGRERRERDPLIIMGGVTTFMNPAVMAPIADLFMIGEGEVLIPQFVAAYAETVLSGRGKEALLQLLAGMPGFYVPAVHGVSPESAVVTRQHLDIGQHPPATSFCVAAKSHLDMFLVEVGRGCGRGCRFCAAGHVYRPFRFWPVEEILAEVERYALAGDRVGLVGAALSDYRDLDQLCTTLLQRGHKIGLSSLRADRITDALLQTLAESDIQTVTLAPEAGTERMRKAVHKNLSDQQIIDAVERIAASGMRHLKFYFMIGLPGEREEDLAAIVTLTRELAGQFSGKRGRTLAVSINAFVPKPWTPFQWAAMADEKEIKHKRKFVNKGLKTIPGVEVSRKSGREELLQGVFSLGDHRVGEELAALVYREEPVNQLYAANRDWLHRDKSLEERLPWQFIDCGQDSGRLWSGWKQSRSITKEADASPAS